MSKRCKLATMEEKKGKKSAKIRARRDYISNLPDEVLIDIISRLTLRDAVKTSLLSPRWRHISASISSLKFDLYSLFRKPNNSKSLCSEYKERFVRAVNQFLEFYKGPRIVSFRLSFCLGSDSASDIDRWIKFAVKMGVTQLQIYLCCFECIKSDKRSGQNELHTIRPQLLTQLGMVVPNYLTKLYLRSFVLGHGVTDQFQCLNVFELFKVHLVEHDVKNILSHCSKLKRLILNTCSLPIKLSIPQSLVCLNRCVFNFCDGVEEIELSATNLKNLQYIGDYLANISFCGVPNLDKVHFRLRNERDVHYVFNRLAKDLPMLKTLSVTLVSCKWIQRMPASITTFRKVEILRLFFPTGTKFDIVKMLSVLRAFPLLQKFHSLTSALPEYDEEAGELELSSKCVHKYLEEVKIGGFCGTQNEIKFVIYLLKYAVSLKQLIIDPELNCYIGFRLWKVGQRTAWGEGERERVCKELREFDKKSVLFIR